MMYDISLQGQTCAIIEINLKPEMETNRNIMDKLTFVMTVKVKGK